MKKTVSIFVVVIILFLSSCQKLNVKTYENIENNSVTLQLHTMKNLSCDEREASDLISDAKKGKAEDMFKIEKFKIKAESQTPPQVAVVSGEVYVAVTTEEKSYLYKVGDMDKKPIFEADSIHTLFEHNGCLMFCATDSSQSIVNKFTYKLMKYDPKAKTLIELNKTDSYSLPSYNSCGNYISFIFTSTPSSSNNASKEKLKVNFCDFSTGNVKKSNKTVDNVNEVSVPVKDINNNLFVTYDKITSQLLFYDIDKKCVVSQVKLDVMSKYSLQCKLFGDRLLIKDSDDLTVYNFNDNSYKLIYRPDSSKAQTGEIYGVISEIIGDIIVFSSFDSLLAYDMKNNELVTICNLEDVSYCGTDNQNTFAFCSAAVELIDGEFYYNIFKYESK